MMVNPIFSLLRFYSFHAKSQCKGPNEIGQKYEDRLYNWKTWETVSLRLTHCINGQHTLVLSHGDGWITGFLLNFNYLTLFTYKHGRVLEDQTKSKVVQVVGPITDIYWKPNT